MVKTNRWVYALVLSGFFFVFSACAQNPPFSGQAYVNEEKLVEKATFLFNNEKELVPLADVGELKIASVHFTYQYTAEFDSLLNKYAGIQSFNGTDYVTIKTLGDLSFDTKTFNTLVVQVTDADLDNPGIVGFINDNQRIKIVIVAFFGSRDNLGKFDGVNAPIIWCARPSQVAAFYSAQAIFGGVPVTQNLIVNYSAKYKKNSGFLTKKIRLEYTAPE